MDLNIQISASTDDCGEWSSSGFSLTGTEITIGNTGNNNWYDGGFRWQNVTIPKGAIIKSAVLSLYVTYDYGTLKTIIKGVDEDDTATWSSGSKPSGRSKTAESVNGNEGNWGNWGVGNWITIDISSIIEEIVNRDNWVSGNALGIVIEDTAGTTFDAIKVRAWNYAGNAHGAKLDINYAVAVTGLFDGKIKIIENTINLFDGLLNIPEGYIITNILSESEHDISIAISEQESNITIMEDEE